MKSHFPIGAVLIATAWLAAAPALAQEVSKETVEGVTNFNRLETTVACAGATSAQAIPEIKKMGFASIINLRQASEPDANLEAETAAASDHRQRQPAGIHSLCTGRARSHDVVYQAAGGRSLGSGTRRKGSGCAGHDESSAQAIRHRLRADAQAIEE